MHVVASFETVDCRGWWTVDGGVVAGDAFSDWVRARERERQRKACAVNRWCVAKPAHFANGNETRN